MWFLTAVILSFVQSLFLSRLLVLILVIILVWKKDDFWPDTSGLIFAVAIVDDLFLAKTLGTGFFIYLLTAAAVKGIKKVFGMRREIKVNF